MREALRRVSKKSIHSIASIFPSFGSRRSASTLPAVHEGLNQSDFLVLNRGHCFEKYRRNLRREFPESAIHAVYTEHDQELIPHDVRAHPVAEYEETAFIGAVKNVVKNRKYKRPLTVLEGWGFVSESARFAQIFSEEFSPNEAILAGADATIRARAGDKKMCRTIAQRVNPKLNPSFACISAEQLSQEALEAYVTSIQQGYRPSILQPPSSISLPLGLQTIERIVLDTYEKIIPMGDYVIKPPSLGGGRGIIMPSAKQSYQEFATDLLKTIKFGDGVLIEQKIAPAFHIELQMLDGMVIGFRDCSRQLNNKKVVEIALLKGVLPPEVIQSLVDFAIGFHKEASEDGKHKFNVWTAEFLLDKNRQPYFLEANTRLQVEHEVTEYTSGEAVEDKVKEGEKGIILPVAQVMLAHHYKPEDICQHYKIPNPLVLQEPGTIRATNARISLSRKIERLSPDTKESMPTSGKAKPFDPGDFPKNGASINLGGIASGKEYAVKYDPQVGGVCSTDPKKVEEVLQLVSSITGVETDAEWVLKNVMPTTSTMVTTDHLDKALESQRREHEEQLKKQERESQKRKIAEKYGKSLAMNGMGMF